MALSYCITDRDSKELLIALTAIYKVSSLVVLLAILLFVLMEL